MRRREFIAGLALPFLARVANAQQHPPMGVSPQTSPVGWPVIGVLAAVRPQSAEYGIRYGLGEAGFAEGTNVAFDYRWASDQPDRLPAVVAELTSRNVAVILSIDNDLYTRAAIAATQTIPIVFTTNGSPVELGFVPNLGHPGRNATGVTSFSQELLPKRLELVREVLPATKRVVLLFNPKSPATAQVEIESAQAAGRRLGLDIIVINTSTVDEIERAITTAVQQQAGAILVTSDTFLSSRNKYIGVLALRNALPMIANDRNAVVSGHLMSYAANTVEVYELAGKYVGRILKGEKPADLPVVQPTKFELTINLTTAKALGLTIPASLLARADEVIE